jgi:hypothetical protein
MMPAPRLPLHRRAGLLPLLAALAALGGPAGAGPLQPARPGLAATNRAALLPVLAHAPRVIDRADGLMADGIAAATLPGMSGAGLDPVDYYAGLDDPAITARALDVPAVVAQGSGASWDWLMLADIALDMNLGDHDEAGRPVRQPDPFAREALTDIAAGAAMNGFVRAQTPGEAVSALALMVRALEDGGDLATAGRVAQAARRFFPDPAATDYDTDISALLRLTEAPPPLPEPPPEDQPGPTRRAGDWLLTCSVGRDCVIQSDTDNLSLEIARSAGPGAPVAVRIVLAGSGWSNANADPQTPRPAARLTVDARPLYPEAAAISFRQAPGAMDGWAYASVPPVRLKAALDTLLGGEKLTLTGTGPSGAALRVDTSLSGLHELARQMDALQGRAGSQTALTDRGPAPAAQVPPAPRARVFAAPVFDRNWPPEPVALTKPAQMVWRTQCPGASDATRDAVALPEGRTVHLRPCPDTRTPGMDRPEGLAAFVSRGNLTEAFPTSDGRVQTWADAFLTAATSGGADAAADSPAPLGLTGIVRGVGYADACPDIETYVWTGGRFVPSRLARLSDCRAARRAPPLIRAFVQEIAG